MEKLRTLSEAQYKRLHDARIYSVTRETTVQEVLKFMRTEDAVVINDEAPLYCNVHLSGHYVGEVYWFGEIGVGIMTWQSWKSNAVQDWEFAESLALDFMLGIEISIFDPKLI